MEFFASEGIEINTPLPNHVIEVPSDESRLVTFNQISALEEKATKISYDFTNFVACSFAKGIKEGKAVYWVSHNNWDDFYAYWERLVEVRAENLRKSLRGLSDG